MHEKDPDELAMMTVLQVRIAARAQARGEADLTLALNDAAADYMAKVVVLLGADGDAVRAHAAKMLADARAARNAMVH